MYEKELIKECRRYNKLAQKELYEKYRNLLRGVCLRYAQNPFDAEDLLHECFIKIITKIRQFKWKGEDSLKSWMIRIVINTAITNYQAGRSNKDHDPY